MYCKVLKTVFFVIECVSYYCVEIIMILFYFAFFLISKYK